MYVACTAFLKSRAKKINRNKAQALIVIML